MGALNDFKRKNSKFIKLSDGESFVARYNGYSMMFNKLTSKDVPVYKFQTEDGEKFLQSQSGKLCAFFDEDEGSAKKGQVVKIKRVGIGMQTNYEPELIINDEFEPDTKVPF